MLISYRWLQSFIGTRLAPEQMAAELKLKTVEVEKMEHQGKNLEQIAVGKIIKVEKHPDADTLQVCQVTIGNETLQVVCGGINVRAGMKVALGKLGAKVKWHGQGELVELKSVKIRGVESSGMICASDEIGLSEMFSTKEEREIIDLSHLPVKLGTPLAEALGLNDVIFDIDNKSLSHRPDLWGHYGLAREVAALFGKKLSAYAPPKIKPGKGAGLRVEVKATALGGVPLASGKKKLCPRYMAAAVDGVRVAPAPAWMQTRLRAVGIRPVNNIVDITNYVMMDIGQPMHAFDARRVKEQGTRSKEQVIVVRRAKTGEQFITLDGKSHQLTSEMLLITDGEKPLAIAGVMGGADSEIATGTTSVIFEAANFDAVSIRRTATALGLRTESSARFEKGLDPTLAELALQRAVELTLELCPGARVASSVVDKWSAPPRVRSIRLPMSDIVHKLGVAIPTMKVVKILTGLGFGVKKSQTELVVTVPSWRAGKDILLPEDLLEEIIRLYGFDQIDAALPTFPITPAPINRLRQLERRLKEVLALEAGYTEVYNYSFASGEWLKRIGQSTADHLELNNPLAKDRPYLRRQLWPNLLANVEDNAHRFERVRLFEIGHAFQGTEPEAQPLLLSAVAAEKNLDTPFFSVSETLAALGARLGVTFTLEKDLTTEDSAIHPGRSAWIIVSGKRVGRLGELHPAVQERLGIPYRVGMLELALNTLLPLLTEISAYHPVPQFPTVTRDVAFVVDRSVTHAAIVQGLAALDPLVGSIELFDMFVGGSIPAGKKSLAYHLVYQSPDRTLTAEAVDRVQEKVCQLLREKFGAEMRK